MTQRLNFSEFAEYIFKELDVPPPDRIDRSQHLLDDLELDSIQVFEMVCIVEDFGIEIPDDSILNMATLGDLYDQYENLLPPG